MAQVGVACMWQAWVWHFQYPSVLVVIQYICHQTKERRGKERSEEREGEERGEGRKRGGERRGGRGEERGGRDRGGIGEGEGRERKVHCIQNTIVGS